MCQTRDLVVWQWWQGIGGRGGQGRGRGVPIRGGPESAAGSDAVVAPYRRLFQVRTNLCVPPGYSLYQDANAAALVAVRVVI